MKSWNLIRATDAERIAKAVMFDQEHTLDLPGKYHEVDVGGNVGDGTRRGTRVMRHPDPIVDLVRWSLCEAETIQAVDRGRHRHRETAAHVVIASATPSIRVDELRPYKHAAGRMGVRGAGGGAGARLGRVFEALGGFCPLDPRWLSERFPDLWATESAAKTEISMVRRGGRSFGGEVPLIYIGDFTTKTFTYRQRGRQGRFPSIILSNQPADRVRAVLERDMGLELSEFTPPTPETTGNVVPITGKTPFDKALASCVVTHFPEPAVFTIGPMPGADPPGPEPSHMRAPP